MSNQTKLKKPNWIRVSHGSGPAYKHVATIIRANDLHTVCDEALCPNKGECWSHGHATVMILGGKCSRSCKFCNIHESETSGIADTGEPRRVASALKQTNLSEIVITSVTRDDLPDGGAAIWAHTLQEIKTMIPEASIEVLVPDFKGDAESLELVIKERPDVFGHNLETVPRLYPAVRPQASFDRSLAVLKQASDAGLITKTSLMLGLGETMDEVASTLHKARTAGASIIFMGQYLQPSKEHHPVVRYLEPSEFENLRKTALETGFAVAVSGPLVRSSYHSDEQSLFVRQITKNTGEEIYKQ